MAETTNTRADVAALLARLSWRRGSFTLASGQTSDFYVDVKQAVMSSEGAGLLGTAVAEILVANGVELVGGMAVGAVPLVSVALCEAARLGHPLDGFFVRRNVKDHGTAAKLDGRFRPEARIALVEDVVTTGGSTLQAVDAVEEAGGRVSLIVTVVDRQENDGMARLAERCDSVVALATRAEIEAAGQ
jgi:orotate phosphoribosyltransferase